MFHLKKKKKRKFVSIDRQYCRFSNETENEKTFIEILIVFVVQFLFGSFHPLLLNFNGSLYSPLPRCRNKIHRRRPPPPPKRQRQNNKRKVNRLRDLLTPCATLHFKRTLTVFPGRNVNKFPIFWLFLFYFRRVEVFVFVFAASCS